MENTVQLDPQVRIESLARQNARQAVVIADLEALIDALQKIIASKDEEAAKDGS